MATSYHPHIRQFQKAREETGLYNTIPTVGYTIRVAQEGAHTVARVVTKLFTTYFVGSKQTES